MSAVKTNMELMLNIEKNRYVIFPIQHNPSENV